MEDIKGTPSKFDKLLADRKAEGWGYVGVATLKETRFVDGLFVERQERTEDDIKRETAEKLGDGFEVDLVSKPAEMFKGEEIPDRFGTYYVFAKKK